VVLKPLLERHSGLKSGEDVVLVYSPERLFVGRALADIVDRYPKVIGSDSDKALRIMSELYSQISKKGVLPMSGATAAELEKLFEGVYRDVNIGLANELADLASRLGISYYEVRDAANSQPYSHLHVPGVGVGGFCIPVYSNYVIDQGKRNSVPTPITATARRSNEDRPKKLSVELLNLMKRSRIKSRAAKVAVLGISFRGNTGDTRLSPSIDLIQHLAPHVAEVRVYDPIAATVRFSRKNISRVDTLEKALFGASAVCVTVEHEEFTKLTFEQLAKPLKRPALIVDYKRVVKGDIPADRTIVSRVTGEPSPGGS
jgi:nucleotide sugar dehydrogenase